MSHLEEARRVLQIESRGILEILERLDSRFERAVDMMVECRGKVIVTGIGKSGIIGRKISSTFSSTGTPAVFLHPAESSHGDLGVIGKGDLLLAISYGGKSPELSPILSFIARKGIPLIAMTGRPDSPLAKAAQIVLDVSVKEEACPMGLAPTTSSTATLALGDALAMAVLKVRGFKEEDFAEFHPGGSLGWRLNTRVKDVMHRGEALPLVSPDEPMTRVVSIMTSKDVRGVAGVVEANGSLIGVITDGDIRRRLEKANTAFTEKARDLMSRNPKTVDQEELAEKALFVMQQFQIQMLFAVNRMAQNPNEPVGLLHLQDLLKAQFR